jgi:glutamine cyclotransferase
MKRSAILILLVALMLTACHNDKSTTDNDTSAAIPAPAVMNYTVTKTYPHDSTSFTEGLFLLNGFFYESTGLNAQSKLLKIDPANGKAVQKIDLDAAYFGEGISVINNKIYQLTYQEHKVFVYDMNFKKLQEFEWPYEGWGMTTDGKQLILDTGGSNLYFINPETFKIERTLGVMDNNGYVDSINELEYVDGYAYANIWQSDYIIKINLKTGMVESRADLSGIHQQASLPAPSKDHVLNGIAYDSAKGSFYVTGKNWPTLFEIKFN